MQAAAKSERTQSERNPGRTFFGMLEPFVCLIDHAERLAIAESSGEFPVLRDGPRRAPSARGEPSIHFAPGDCFQKNRVACLRLPFRSEPEQDLPILLFRPKYLRRAAPAAAPARSEKKLRSSGMRWTAPHGGAARVGENRIKLKFQERRQGTCVRKPDRRAAGGYSAALGMRSGCYDNSFTRVRRANPVAIRGSSSLTRFSGFVKEPSGR